MRNRPACKPCRNVAGPIGRRLRGPRPGARADAHGAGRRRSRKTLIYLILTLNHCYPDYDFSLLRAHHFRKEPGVSAVEQAVDAHLLEASRARP
jgi:hypothetical protein